VERTVQPKLIDPADLWRGGVVRDQLRGGDGEIDPALVEEAVATVREQHPHWGVPRLSPAAPASLVTSAEKPDIDHEQPTWQGVIQSAMRKP
jgi:hypothetical protein